MGNFIEIFSGNSTIANLLQRARFGAMLREFVLEVRIPSALRPSLPFATAESKSARTAPKLDQLGEAANRSRELEVERDVLNCAEQRLAVEIFNFTVG